MLNVDSDSNRIIKNTTLVIASTQSTDDMISIISLDVRPVKVNSVMFGIIDIPLWTDYLNFEEFAVAFISDNPVVRIKNSDSVADTVICLMTNGYITSKVIVVDTSVLLI